MMTTRPTNADLTAPFLEKVKEEHRVHVKGVLSDLQFYVGGSLSYHHASPIVKALLTNKLSYIAQRAGDVDLLYLGVYGEFIYEHVPPDKLMEKT